MTNPLRTMHPHPTLAGTAAMGTRRPLTALMERHRRGRESVETVRGPSGTEVSGKETPLPGCRLAG